MDVPQNLLLLSVLRGHQKTGKSKSLNYRQKRRASFLHLLDPNKNLRLEISFIFSFPLPKMGWFYINYSFKLLKQWNVWLADQSAWHLIKGKLQNGNIYGFDIFDTQKSMVSTRFWRLGPLSLVEKLRPSASTSSSPRSAGFGPGCADESRGPADGWFMVACWP